MVDVKLAQEYLKKVFIENPAYSFGDWTVMYEHSLNVRDLAMKIADRMECDKESVELFALFHDIGKAFKADDKYLHEHHAELGFRVAEPILPQLSLTAEQSDELTAFLKGDLSSQEARIAKDADAIAFFMDEKLQSVFKAWADKNGLPGELQRKADKFKTLRFEQSKKIAEPFHDSMVLRWGLK